MSSMRFFKEYKSFKADVIKRDFLLSDEEKAVMLDVLEDVYNKATNGKVILDEAMMRMAHIGHHIDNNGRFCW